MKKKLAKPDLPTMKFFTPDLYRQFNSDDAEMMAAGFRGWDDAIKRYRTHLRKFQKRLKDGGGLSIIKLSKLCFHDAEIKSWEEIDIPFQRFGCQNHKASSSRFLFLLMEHCGSVTELIYELWDVTHWSSPIKKFPFSKNIPYWGYDELDFAPSAEDRFQHRIFFSTGHVVEIPFYSVNIRKWPFQVRVNDT